MAEVTRLTAPARAAGAAIRERIRRDGFVVLKGLLPPGEVTGLRGLVAGVLADHGHLKDGAPPDDLVPDANRRDGSPGWWHMYEDLQRLEAMHRLAHHPALTGPARATVGGRLLNHPRRYLSLVPPGFRIPPHQEYLQIQGTPDVLTAWIPLTRSGPDTCALRVLRESGPRRVRPLTTLPAPFGGAEAEAPPADDPAWWVGTDLVPGDVVLLHGLTVWGCDENRSPGLAGSLWARYQPARLPVCRASLHPHHYPRLPGWKALTRGWSSRRWVRTPWPRREAPFVLARTLEDWHREVPPPAAELVDVIGP
ncbi:MULTISPECIES: phytanoyl-CoA dioxygenase family protein [Actinomadura]|uniref:Phytanoyl-CoA dioxygenase (PhyH) n=1 Tax=Actinomadura madurae TaxID=1993 RepID=A0A1I5GUG5_9ACTN|nr:phytanoyl-CoA dioxygenase family protein [Actinomadura madurae]SFO39652.1 Phytanoyl-CoA dioxygenase (PhyH) [Actinomadura madurae]SPT51529.1 Phytanoyl-CoA dioxygenase (PhyH) [Actinomadura madurae]